MKSMYTARSFVSTLFSTGAHRVAKPRETFTPLTADDIQHVAGGPLADTWVVAVQPVSLPPE